MAIRKKKDLSNMLKVGFPISTKENENRRCILPEQLKYIKHRDYLFFETGFENVLGINDQEYIDEGAKILSKDEILNSVWHGRIVCENTVSVALSNIRKLLRRVDPDCRCLVTVARAGYIFYPYRSGFTIDNSNDI